MLIQRGISDGKNPNGESSPETFRSYVLFSITGVTVHPHPGV